MGKEAREMRINYRVTRISWSPLPGESWHLRWRYMIPIRLPWRPRARPSATLHEIPACSKKSELGFKYYNRLIGLSSGIYTVSWRTRRLGGQSPFSGCTDCASCLRDARSRTGSDGQSIRDTAVQSLPTVSDTC